jgi:hypothetical protein
MNNQVFYFLFLILLITGCNHLTAQQNRSENKLHTRRAELESILVNTSNSRGTVTSGKLLSAVHKFYCDPTTAKYTETGLVRENFEVYAFQIKAVGFISRQIESKTTFSNWYISERRPAMNGLLAQ